MKKFYMIMGQSKDDKKWPVSSWGWFKNKKEALDSFKDKKGFKAVYGFNITVIEFIKYFIFSLDIDIVCEELKDLK